MCHFTIFVNMEKIVTHISCSATHATHPNSLRIPALLKAIDASIPVISGMKGCKDEKI